MSSSPSFSPSSSSSSSSPSSPHYSYFSSSPSPLLAGLLAEGGGRTSQAAHLHLLGEALSGPALLAVLVLLLLPAKPHRLETWLLLGWLLPVYLIPIGWLLLKALLPIGRLLLGALLPIGRQLLEASMPIGRLLQDHILALVWMLPVYLMTIGRLLLEPLLTIGRLLLGHLMPIGSLLLRHWLISQIPHWPKGWILHLLGNLLRLLYWLLLIWWLLVHLLLHDWLYCLLLCVLPGDWLVVQWLLHHRLLHRRLLYRLLWYHRLLYHRLLYHWLLYHRLLYHRLLYHRRLHHWLFYCPLLKHTAWLVAGGIAACWMVASGIAACWMVASGIAACWMVCELYILNCFLNSFSYFFILTNWFWSCVILGLVMVSSLAAPPQVPAVSPHPVHAVALLLLVELHAPLSGAEAGGGVLLAQLLWVLVPAPFLPRACPSLKVQTFNMKLLWTIVFFGFFHCFFQELVLRSYPYHFGFSLCLVCGQCFNFGL